MKDAIRKLIEKEMAQGANLADAIEDLSEWDRYVSVVEFRNLDVHSPAMLRTLASFAEDLSQVMGQELRVTFSAIQRDKTDKELRDAAIERAYWNRKDYWEELAGE